MRYTGFMKTFVSVTICILFLTSLTLNKPASGDSGPLKWGPSTLSADSNTFACKETKIGKMTYGTLSFVAPINGLVVKKVFLINCDDILKELLNQISMHENNLEVYAYRNSLNEVEIEKRTMRIGNHLNDLECQEIEVRRAGLVLNSIDGAPFGLNKIILSAIEEKALSHTPGGCL